VSYSGLEAAWGRGPRKSLTHQQQLLPLPCYCACGGGHETCRLLLLLQPPDIKARIASLLEREYLLDRRLRGPGAACPTSRSPQQHCRCCPYSSALLEPHGGSAARE